MSDFAPAPTGPAAIDASPPSLNELESSEFIPLSVITSVTISLAARPAWKPTLAVASV